MRQSAQYKIFFDEKTNAFGVRADTDIGADGANSPGAVPALPKALHGTPFVAIAACWTGNPAAGESAMRPLKTFGSPVVDTITTKPFVAHQTMLDAGQPFGRRYYWKSDFSPTLAKL